MQVATNVVIGLCLTLGIGNYLFNLIRLIAFRANAKQTEMTIGRMKIFGYMTCFTLVMLFIDQFAQRHAGFYHGNSVIALAAFSFQLIAFLVAMMIQYEEIKWAP